jgi:hypothetical protein
MHRKTGVLSLIVLLTLGLSSAADEIQFSTFYPAPFGAYDRMKLVPRSSFSASDCDEQNEVGVIYYDDGKDKKPEGLYVCQKFDQNQFGWVFITKPFGPERHKDALQESTVVPEKVVCVRADKSLGVCMNNPSADGTCACQ